VCIPRARCRMRLNRALLSFGLPDMNLRSGQPTTRTGFLRSTLISARKSAIPRTPAVHSEPIETNRGDRSANIVRRRPGIVARREIEIVADRKGLLLRLSNWPADSDLNNRERIGRSSTKPPRCDTVYGAILLQEFPWPSLRPPMNSIKPRIKQEGPDPQKKRIRI